MTFGLSGTAIAAIGIGGAAIGSSLIGANSAENAEDKQYAAANKGIDEQKRQFDAMQKLLSPYVNAGTGALQGQQDILGLNGANGQQAAINGIQSGPQFQAMQQQGENAILQNASATGGLRGGNTQAALAQFRPQLLAQLLQQQYQNLGGISAAGQNAAAGVGAAGLQTGANVSNLFQQQGAGQAGLELAKGNAASGIINAPLQALGGFIGLGGKF